MTREEARASIKKHLDLMYPYNTPKDVLKVAYEALGQPEIIRCKDCVYRNNTGVSNQWLPCMDTNYPDNFYCGRGERKDGDGIG